MQSKYTATCKNANGNVDTEKDTAWIVAHTAVWANQSTLLSTQLSLSQTCLSIDICTNTEKKIFSNTDIKICTNIEKGICTNTQIEIFSNTDIDWVVFANQAAVTVTCIFVNFSVQRYMYKIQIQIQIQKIQIQI